MNLETFAAQRGDDLTAAMDRIRPKVRAALSTSDPAAALMDIAMSEFSGDDEERFRADIEEALELTRGDGTDAQLERVTGWLATAALNASVVYAGVDGAKTWVTMLDDDVRELHQGMHGVTVGTDDTFDLAGVPTFYPGQPIGPIEHWINCRCVLAIEATVTAAATAQNYVRHNEAAAAEARSRLVQNGIIYIPESNTYSTVTWNITDEDDDTEPPVPDSPYDMADDEPMQWHSIMTVEGVPSGDKRSFQKNSLSWRDLPLPLEWQKVTAAEHDGSIVVGRIDGLMRKEMGDHNQIRSWGVFTSNVEADDVVGLIAERALRGVSPTIDDYALAEGGKGEMNLARGRVCSGTIVNVPAFPEAWLKLGPPPADWFEDEPLAAAAIKMYDDGIIDTEHFREFTKPQRDKAAEEGHAMPDGGYPIKNLEDLRNAIQAIGRAKDPAAVKRHIRKRARALGHPELIPDSWASADEQHFARGAGWVTHPKETRRLHRYWTRGAGAAKIRWGQPHDFYRCRRQLAKYIAPSFLSRVCAQWHHDALGYWPGEHNSADTVQVASEACDCGNMAIVASAAVATKLPPAAWFDDPHLDAPTPLTVTRDGRLFGHLATWGTCHLKWTGECIEPPHSKFNYAYFRTGAAETDGGEIPVGVVTMNALHADDEWDVFKTRYHYEHTGIGAARVVAGEDQHGIWLAGQMMMMSEGDYATFRAASLSGDWRLIAGSLELIGALAVNIPGFPVPRVSLAASAGVVTSLVAANIVEKHAEGVDIDALADAIMLRMAANEAKARRAAALNGRVAVVRAEALENFASSLPII